jgi:hypothetical protein
VLTDSSSRHFSLSDETDGFLHRLAVPRVVRSRYIRGRAIARLRAVLVSSAGLGDETRRLCT